MINLKAVCILLKKSVLCNQIKTYCFFIFVIFYEVFYVIILMYNFTVGSL